MIGKEEWLDRELLLAASKGSPVEKKEKIMKKRNIFSPGFQMIYTKEAQQEFSPIFYFLFLSTDLRDGICDLNINDYW